MVGRDGRALLPGFRSDDLRGNGTVRDSNGHRSGSSRAVLHVPHVTRWRLSALPLRDPLLEVKMSRLDFSYHNHFLLLPVVSELHLLLGIPPRSRIFQKQTDSVSLALFPVPSDIPT